jgi:imidazolonepropionase
MLKPQLIGPFSQLVTMNNLPAQGSIREEQLEIIPNAGIIVNGHTIEAVGIFSELKTPDISICPVEGDHVAIPGFIDVHTHLCWAGSRARDYGMRLEGKSYQEIAAMGGGIWSTVLHTRSASENDLANITLGRVKKQLAMGITTMEVKSGYCLNVEGELKMLRAIHRVAENTPADVIATCLAAHIRPKDFAGTDRDYLNYILKELLTEVAKQKLSTRVDAYIDQGAFSVEDGTYYLEEAQKMGFHVSVHADQFSPGGIQAAINVKASSADHLESTPVEALKQLASSGVIPVVLPGASMGLGMPFAPARKILDSGASLVIASDWNPGSAPMGKLLLQASVLGVYEHLSMAETLAAITCRAAKVLDLNDRAVIRPGMRADFIVFPCDDFHEVIYNQGSLLPDQIWKNGRLVI